MGNWISSELHDLTPENMSLLLEHKIPAIRVQDFVDRKVCDVVASRLLEMRFANYDHLKDIPVHQIGLCHNQWAHDDKSIYFGKCEEAKRIVDEIYHELNIDPVQMVIQSIRDNGGRQVSVFHEDGFGKYFAGAFRSFKGHGKLHADHAPSHISTPWSVTKISKQLTWNIYYCAESDSGELVIYDTIHTRENDKLKVEGDYYFPYEVLEREDCVRIIPKVGDLIIFNTQNFHEILGTPDGNRISQTSFIGLREDGSLGLWS
ncbi:hypothetical protein FDY93_03875 [Microbulbifer harenosus]|uniref:Prolyl 4-hydroxylase alpha subunit Fe(2+) 2OG dioxygenase domain-containing protein n=2 Tax=Microbulbifer harenosus TaxID=2576840 RepID=A0ABY2UM10_9GAMM|nr:hypothetical protein FDY93_03875 [Microbulbifer harenosus]